MQLNQIQPNKKLSKKKRIGRGGKRGTYSGKGMKGQKSRAGFNPQPVIRELIKSYPKLRGYRNKGLGKSIAVLNVVTLEKEFNDSATVTPDILVEKKIIRRIGGKTPVVKVLGKGDITKKIILQNCLVSSSAKEKIEKAGGTVK